MRTNDDHARSVLAWLIESGYIEVEHDEPGVTHVLVHVDVRVWPRTRVLP